MLSSAHAAHGAYVHHEHATEGGRASAAHRPRVSGVPQRRLLYSLSGHYGTTVYTIVCTPYSTIGCWCSSLSLFPCWSWLYVLVAQLCRPSVWLHAQLPIACMRPTANLGGCAGMLFIYSITVVDDEHQASPSARGRAPSAQPLYHSIGWRLAREARGAPAHARASVTTVA